MKKEAIRPPKTRSVARLVLFTALVLTLLAVPIYRGYRIFRSDRIVRAEQTVESYSRALEYDPSNATLWWHRGRLSHYSVDLVDIHKAIGDYQKALSLNPRLSQAWVDLADCYERMGDYGPAEEALTRALALRTYSPLIQWQAGNFFLRRGKLAKMYECFKLASFYDIQKLDMAMSLAWKADPDHTQILAKLVPDTLPANVRYLNFLLARGESDLARGAWERSLHNEIPSDFEYRVSIAFPFIDHLIEKSRISEARQIWDEVLQKAGKGPLDNGLRWSRQPAGAANLIWNGSFENEILWGGFDWRYRDTDGVSIQTDIADRMDGLKSLKAIFDGTNISFSHFSQIIPIPNPGAYRLEFYARSDNLTTDQRPYITIHGYPEPPVAYLRTEPFPPSTPWRKYSFSFTAGEKCNAVQLTLRRDQSSKFDNLINGILWLDKFSIHPIQ